jgi:hypothetical protein
MRQLSAIVLVGTLILSCQVVNSQPDELAVRQAMVDASIAAYSGNCPCPENRDRAGRRCGKRSAYSRPGGAAPHCYPDKIPAEEVARFMATMN